MSDHRIATPERRIQIAEQIAQDCGFRSLAYFRAATMVIPKRSDPEHALLRLVDETCR